MNDFKSLFKKGKSPEVLLVLLSIGMMLAFSTWQALLNNFAVDNVGFDGARIGILQSIREIPGLLAFSITFILIFFREQQVMLAALILLGIGTALTGFFPYALGLYLTTFLMSTGFHYFETARQSLALQWIDKDETPVVLGQLVSAGSFAALVSFAIIYLGLDFFDLQLKWIYVAGGFIAVIITVYCWVAFPSYSGKVQQKSTIVLRSRYWLWYGLVFMSGARRQIFVVFAGFLMVEKFGFTAAEMTLMFLANMTISIFIAPKIGRLIKRFGERRALLLEYSGLVLVFVGYALADQAWIGVILYILDHMFFAMAIAIKTYFQKIAVPADISSSSAVSFTISHLVAVIIPAGFGLIWLVAPSYVFMAGAAMAGISLVLAFFVPKNPDHQQISIFSHPSIIAKPAE